MIPFNLLLRGWRAVLRLVDHAVEPPIMRRHINAGSARYFRNEDRFRDRSSFNDIAGDRVDDGEEPGAAD